MRKLTAGMIVGISGKKLLLINFAVSAAASMSANFCNSLCMRYPEIEKGIEVFSDEELKVPAGISQKCAESAVYETAYSRVAMSFMVLAIPVALVLASGKMGIKPKGTFAKNLLQMTTIGLGLQLGLPMSVAIFPPVSIKNGSELEESFHIHEKIYFNKGL